MKKFILCIMFLCSIWLIFLQVGFAQSASPTNEHSQNNEFQQMQYIAAWTSFAVYDDRLGALANEVLTKYGWQTKLVKDKIHKSDVKLLFATKEMDNNPVYFLSISGTNSWLDVKTDLNIQSVVFAGSNALEFTDFMQEQTTDKSIPRIHKGFAQYIQDGFFTKPQKECANLPLGEFLANGLKQNPQAKLYLTGHSLGGAAAEVLAARLLSMGVNPDQLVIITFGAPAVGNQAFVDDFGSKMNLTRITLKGDPVKNLAQIANDHLVQFKQNTIWNLPWSEDDKFAHGMLLYFDGAMRQYYDTITTKQHLPADYVINVSFDFPEQLKSDEFYIKMALADKMQLENKSAIFVDNANQVLAIAKQNKAKYSMLYKYEAKLLKDTPSNKRYYLNCTKYIYDENGKFITAASASTDTNDMTVVQAALYTDYRLK